MAWCAVLLLLLSVSTSAGAQQTDEQTFHQHIRPEVANRKAALVGALPADQELALSIVLPLSNQATLTTLLGRLYDPASPDFHHFLSVSEFTEQFGPSTDDYQRVVAFARSQGLKVTEAPANRLIVPVRGTVDAVNRAFGVSMNVYQHPSENRTFFSPDRDPTLPANLHVTHINGLNNFSLPHPMVRPQSQQQPQATVTGSGPGGSYLGSDMRAAYYGGTTLTGLGQSIGLVEFAGYNLADVNSTFTNAGQSYTVPINNVLLDGATLTGTQFGGEGEVVLDIVQAIGMAPALDQVRVYIGTGQDDAHILNSMATENIAKVLSCSWSWTPDDPTVDDVFFQEFAAQGQSFLTASGDDGAFDSFVSPYFYPQEDAYVTAVGGTHLTTNGPGGSWSAETAWNSYGAGSGGGVSPDNIAIPSWQTGLANSANGGSNTLRNVPDVAMEGDFDNYACELGSCSQGYAGTSFAAPRWAGFLALVNQQAVEAGTAPQGGIGFINPAIYRLAQAATSSSDFHDITSGNNNTANQPVYFSAASGYDLVTGWGSANGQSLIDALAGPQVPGFWLQASSPTVNVNQGSATSTTLTVTDAGGFSSPVTLALSSTLPSGVTATWGTNPTAGTSVLTLTATNTAAPSSAAVTITGTSGTLSASTTITVAVHAPTFLIAASPNPVTVNQGATTTTTLTVTPEYGFTGSVNLAVSGLPSGVTATLGTNPTSGSSVLTLVASSSATPGTTPITITGTAGSLSVTLSLPLSVHGPSFTLNSSYSTVDVGQGASAAGSVYVNDLYGFNGNVNLAITGLPAGVTAVFSPNPTALSSTLTLNASSAAAPGTSTVTITGTSGALSASTTVTLRVHVPTFLLSNPGAISIGQGSSASSYIYVSPQYGFNGSVTFSVAGLPAGVTALWNPNPSNGGTTLTLSAAGTAAVGQYPLTITGTSGSQSSTTNVTLGVYQPTFTLSGGSISLGQGTTSTSYVLVNPQYGFTGSVSLAASNLPAGVTVSFSPNPTTGSALATFTASSAAAPGQYTVTLTGTSGTKSVTNTLTVSIFQPTFSLSGPYTVNVGQGTSQTSSVYVYGQYGFNGSVQLAVSGLPAGVTASFSPNPTTGTSQLILTASSTAALGQYTATVTGTSGSQTASMHFTVGVYVPAFTLSGASSLSVGQGSSASTYLYLYNQYGFNGSVQLSVSGLPAGVTASFSPNPTTFSSSLIITAASSAALGQYNLTITGTSGSLTTTSNLTLGIYAPAFTLSASSLTNVGQGTTSTSYVSVYNQYGFNGAVTLSLSGLPAGVTASFSPNPTVGGSSTIAFTVAPTAALGQYPLTITGTSGSLTASTAMTLGVYAPSFSLYGGYGNVSMNQGGSATTYFYINDQYGFNSPVTLSASGLPSGVTATFSPNPTSYSSTVTLNASSTAATGQATVTITGTAGAVTASTTLPLTVNASTFSLTAAPGQIRLPANSSATSVLVITPQNGFTGSVHLAISGLPAGVTGTFSADSITSTGVLTLTAGASATAGTTTATITGTAGSLTASTPLTITIASSAPATATTLAITAAGSPVTTLAAHTPVTLTAKVSGGSSPLTAGTVVFCDTTGTACDSSHLLGTAQLTSSGAAALTLIPSPGNHSFRAAFLGVTGQAPSISAAGSLAVTASQTSITTIAQSGTAGQYTLTATVTGQGATSPSGAMAFLDTTNGNATLGTATLASAGATLSFPTGLTTATSSDPTAAAIADFNGDGIPDLALSDTSGNSVSILLGNGDGTFATTTASLSTGSQPSSIIAADFNADGKLDLAITNSSNSAISIFLGRGDGTFTPSPLSPQTGSVPRGITVADFNGDGKLDLAVANEYSSSLTILLGNGDGTFTPSPLSPQTGGYPDALVAADFNGDSIPDLAVANANSSSVSIFLGNGDGSFATAASIPVGSGPGAIVTGDFNHDGKADLAVVNSYGSTISLLLGKGDSTFTTSTLSTSGFSLANLAVADLNNDGNPDLAFTSYNQVLTLLGKGDGTFSTGPSAAIGGTAPFLSVADLNGDGIQDLVTSNSYATNLAVFPGQLAQTARASATGINPAGSGLHALVAAYPGDTAWKASTSAATQLTAQVQTPTLAVVPSIASITTVQSLTVSVTLTGPGGNPAPTGTVVLSSGSFSTSAASLKNGAVTFTVPAGTLAAGTATLTGTYTPDTAGAVLYTGVAGSATVTVTTAPKITPVVTITPAANTLTTAQSTTLTITVAGTAGYPTPTGAVVVTGAGFTSAAAPLGGGTASITVPAGVLATGTDSLTASYTPDAAAGSAFNSASGSVVLTVTAPPKTTPTVAVTASMTALTTTQPVTVTIMVSGATGSAVPSGNVTLAGGGYTTVASPLSNGSVALTIPAGALTVGADALTATFVPDTASAAAYNGATGGLTLTVAAPPKAPGMAVTPSATAITTAQSLSVAVALSAGTGSPLPTGSVTLTAGSFSATQPLSSASTTFSLPAGAFPAGSNTLKAVYTPDSGSAAVYTAVTQTAVVTVSPAIGTAAATVSVNASPVVVTDMQSTTVTVTVAGNGTPSGTVTLTSGAYSAQQALSNGTASFTVKSGSLATGSDTLTAAYAGDAVFAPASATTTVTVTPVIITASAPPPVAAGAVTTSSLTLNTGSYSGTMNLTCSLTSAPAGAQSLPTCTLNPVVVQVTSGSSLASTLSVHTTAASTALAVPLNRWKTFGFGTPALASLLLILLPGRRRPRLPFLALLLIALGTTLAGCGGGSSPGSGSTPPTGSSIPATTAGQYTFAVTGTDASNAKIAVSTSVSVTVQ